MSRVERVWEVETELGEGPLWSAAEQALYWLDIENPRVFRYTPASGARETFPVPEEIGSIALRRGGGLVAAGRSGFHFLEVERGALEPIADPEPDLAGNRFNDGECDACGRFWAGTMDDACRAPSGALYRLDPDRTVTRMDAGYAVTNGPAFAPDGRTMIHNDTTRGRVYAFDLDLATGAIANKRVFAAIPAADGLPDGVTFDAEGFLWLAHWGGARLTRFAPDGTIERVVTVPAENVTSCAFGGPELATLYVTTATAGLFAFEPGVVGLPAATYAG